ncbi:hypothetical protein PG1780B_1256 [Bifidobacterium pseudolongum subsp. globosum]|uniref:Uncharacterized protein n=1 Tax=Bifidobacterium pseudolongum subsp. globosum TaxID=1690 RepID=A0A8B3RME0_9BIFI|nr:hypothetical protein PG1780B_1256 [Bifidobacterium pseudolongum subsp. globosum]
MRGKLLDEVQRLEGQRIIPAHAGQTPPAAPRRYAPGNHPRACGANALIMKATQGTYGSSPRMRGKLPRIARRVFQHGIIPAHAGQTLRWSVSMWRPADHPRACGANNFSTYHCTLFPGSSPRMRGKHILNIVTQLWERIIPAHAGQTSSLQSCSAASRKRCAGNPVESLVYREGRYESTGIKTSKGLDTAASRGRGGVISPAPE